jgi:hypothetical protein
MVISVIDYLNIFVNNRGNEMRRFANGSIEALVLNIQGIKNTKLS